MYVAAYLDLIESFIDSDMYKQLQAPGPETLLYFQELFNPFLCI